MLDWITNCTRSTVHTSQTVKDAQYLHHNKMYKMHGTYISKCCIQNCLVYWLVSFPRIQESKYYLQDAAPTDCDCNNTWPERSRVVVIHIYSHLVGLIYYMIYHV